MEKRKKFLTFNDGIAEIYRVENGAENGNRNIEVLHLLDRVRFHTHTVGFQRYYEAMQYDVKITRAIVIPQITQKVSTQDVIKIEGKRYKIEQIQERADTLPPSLLLSLSDTEEIYGI